MLKTNYFYLVFLGKPLVFHIYVSLPRGSRWNTHILAIDGTCPHLDVHPVHPNQFMTGFVVNYVTVMCIAMLK